MVVSLVAVVVVIVGIWGAIMAFDIKPRLGLDLRGGTSVTFRPHNPNGGQPTKQQMDTTIDIIRNRVNSKGVAEWEVTKEGGNIVVSIADVKNPDDVIRAVGTTAQLQFRPVLAAVTASEPKYKQPPFNAVDCSKPATWLGKDRPKEQTVLCASESGQQSPRANALKLQMGPVSLGGTDITGAHAELQTTGGQNSVATGQWVTRLDFSGAGDNKFKDLTGKAACNPENDPKRQIAIILASVIINNPPVSSSVACNQGISGGSAVIRGQTESQAQVLAGLIVAIGISADSYVVFFERLKDEVRDGRTLRTSVDRGWDRSFHTLVSANSVSFLAALILYLFAIGPVRGFAFTLGLATLIDFFAVWTYGRPAVNLLTRSRVFQEGRLV